jgi:hypothetical protein
MSRICGSCAPWTGSVGCTWPSPTPMTWPRYWLSWPPHTTALPRTWATADGEGHRRRVTKRTACTGHDRHLCAHGVTRPRSAAATCSWSRSLLLLTGPGLVAVSQPNRPVVEVGRERSGRIVEKPGREQRLDSYRKPPPSPRVPRRRCHASHVTADPCASPSLAGTGERCLWSPTHKWMHAYHPSLRGRQPAALGGGGGRQIGGHVRRDQSNAVTQCEPMGEGAEPWCAVSNGSTCLRCDPGTRQSRKFRRSYVADAGGSVSEAMHAVSRRRI